MKIFRLCMQRRSNLSTANFATQRLIWDSGLEPPALADPQHCLFFKSPQFLVSCAVVLLESCRRNEKWISQGSCARNGVGLQQRFWSTLFHHGVVTLDKGLTMFCEMESKSSKHTREHFPIFSTCAHTFPNITLEPAAPCTTSLRTPRSRPSFFANSNTSMATAAWIPINKLDAAAASRLEEALGWLPPCLRSWRVPDVKRYALMVTQSSLASQAADKA